MTKEQAVERINKIITTKFNNDYSIDDVDKEAIEELLKAYKELKEIVKELEEWNEYYRKDTLSKEYIKLNYIPKSKVEEKIGELNKQLEEDLQDEIKVNSNRFIIICQCKSCLQELLGSEE